MRAGQLKGCCLQRWCNQEVWSFTSDLNKLLNLPLLWRQGHIVPGVGGEEVPFNLLNSDWLHNPSQTQSYSCDVIGEGLRCIRVTNGYRRASCACVSNADRHARAACTHSRDWMLPLLSGVKKVNCGPASAVWKCNKVSVVCPSKDMKGGLDGWRNWKNVNYVEQLLVRVKLFLFIVTPTRLNMLKMVCANY